jgi:hypothetical protein
MELGRRCYRASNNGQSIIRILKYPHKDLTRKAMHRPKRGKKALIREVYFVTISTQDVIS